MQMTSDGITRRRQLAAAIQLPAPPNQRLFNLNSTDANGHNCHLQCCSVSTEKANPNLASTLLVSLDHFYVPSLIVCFLSENLSWFSSTFDLTFFITNQRQSSSSRYQSFNSSSAAGKNADMKRASCSLWADCIFKQTCKKTYCGRKDRLFI